MRCRCGRSTFLVPGYDPMRTCSKCGYLTTYCKCQKSDVSKPSVSGGLNMSERTRGLIGAAVVSAMGTMFATAFLTSPFFAMFGLGIPFAITAGFFVQWLRGEPPTIVALTSDAVSAPVAESRVQA